MQADNKIVVVQVYDDWGKSLVQTGLVSMQGRSQPHNENWEENIERH